MKLLQKKEPIRNAIGYYLDIAPSDTNEVTVNCIEDGPFRATITVYIPPSNAKTMLQQLIAAIKKHQNGRCFPVRMRWENIKRFFSLDDLQLLGFWDRRTTYYLYGAPHSKPKYDTDAVIRKLDRERYREKKEMEVRTCRQQ